jgi:hypothetical protein
MADEEVKSDVQEMNKAFGYEPADVVDEVKTDVEVEEEETVEEAEVEGDEEESEEEIPAIEDDQEGDEPEEEEDERDKTIAELRKKLADKEAPEPEQEPVEEPIQFDSQSFIAEDEDLDDLVRDPEKLNEVFNKIYQRAVTDTRKVLGEGILRSIPDIVRASVDIMDKLKQMNTKFYTDNKDLEPFKKVVASVFEEIASGNPGKDMMTLLPMVATESRKRLELHKQAVQPSDRVSPRLPRRKQRTTLLEDKPDTNPLLKELSEMSKIIRR